MKKQLDLVLGETVVLLQKIGNEGSSMSVVGKLKSVNNRYRVVGDFSAIAISFSSNSVINVERLSNGQVVIENK